MPKHLYMAVTSPSREYLVWDAASEQVYGVCA